MKKIISLVLAFFLGLMLATLPPVLGSTPLPGQHRVPPPISRPVSTPIQGERRVPPPISRPSPMSAPKNPQTNPEPSPLFPPKPSPMSTPTFKPPLTYCNGERSSVPCGGLRDNNTVPGGGE